MLSDSLVLSSDCVVFTGAVKPPCSILSKKPNFDALWPYFGWTTADCVEATLENTTTQWFRASGWLPMHCHYKTRFPAANVPHWNEDVATDTFFSDMPAHDDGIPGHGVVLLHRFILELLAKLPQPNSPLVVVFCVARQKGLRLEPGPMKALDATSRNK